MSDDKLRELLSRYSTTAVFLQGGLRLAPKVQFQVKARPLAEVCRSSPDRKEVIRWQNEEPVIDAAVSGDVKVKHYHRDRLEALLQSIESSTGGTLQNNSPWVAWSALPDWWKAAARKIATAESLRNMQGKAPDGIDGSQFPADLRSLVNSDSDTWGIFNRDSDFSLGTRRFSLSRPLAKSPERLFVSREIANVITSLAARFKLPLED
jgi:hypothetical protein